MYTLGLILGLAMPLPSQAEAWPSPDSIDIQGHRGARGLLPENTIPAFLKALDLGVSTLEMDVVISADHQVVVSHEPWFSAEICSTPDGTPVSAADEMDHNMFTMTLKEIQRYDCGSRGHARFPRQEPLRVSKPSLREVIRTVEAHRAQHELPLFEYNIETKSRPEWDGVFHPDPGTFARLLHEVVTEEGVLERSTLQSFDVRTLRWAREHDPTWRLVLLIPMEAGPSVDDHLDHLGFVPHAYSPDHRIVDAAMVRRIRELGMKLIPWTVNTAEEMQHLITLGVDGIITDYPDIALELVGSK